MNLNHLKRQIVTAAYKSGEGHIGSAFSILDILWVLYDRVLMPDDRFILSKGQAALALYAVLAEKGYFPASDLDTFCRYDSYLGGHPDCHQVPGVFVSTGSLGHGLAIGVGMAMAKRIQKQAGRVFVLVGDGECNEGAVWEAALLAAHHKLGNLTCIVDYNHSGDRALRLGNIADKFGKFGWVMSEVDGHDDAVLDVWPRNYLSEYPSGIIAHTIKGNGCKRMENNQAWHHRAPTAEELPEILEELA